MMKEFLDSDRVNYLVWRYLLESNYREAAAKLQKEWQVQEPHRHFDFARHVKSHALVSVVNKGLCYHALEREHANKLISSNATAADAAEHLQQQHFGIFGPLIAQPPLHKVENDDAMDEVEHSRKRQLDGRPHPHQVNGSPAKRPKLSNGYENGVDAAAAATTPMEIDHQHQEHQHQHQHQNQTQTQIQQQSQHPTDRESNHAYPSPQEGEQAPTPVTHTDGPEQGTQVDKVQELAPETIFLRLMPGDSGPGGSAATPSSPTPTDAAAASANANASASASASANAGANADADANANPSNSTTGNSTNGTSTNGTSAGTASASTSTSARNTPILLRCEWNPKDPSILAAAGTDALARVWTVSRSTTGPQAGEADADHVNGVDRPSRSLMDNDAPRNATVSQMAWDSKGSAIAVATDSDGTASVRVWAEDDAQVAKFDVPEAPIFKLCWNPTDTALLAIAPASDGALISIFHPYTDSVLTYLLSGHDLLSWPLDAAWTSPTELLLCGGGMMIVLRYTETDIVVERKLETRSEDQFLQVSFDERSRIAATASHNGVLDLWDETGERRSISAHSGAITELQWQPLPAGAQVADDERLIASGGDDSAILIWNARRPEQKSKSFMTMDGPIVGLAFTPDGAFIAGATAGRILIWKVGDPSVPRASWSRTPHPGWLSPKTNSESEDEDEHCLGWDCDGQRLAYGANSRLAVINFRRS